MRPPIARGLTPVRHTPAPSTRAWEPAREEAKRAPSVRSQNNGSREARRGIRLIASSAERTGQGEPR